MKNLIINNHSRQTNWYLITGEPSFRKATTITYFESKVILQFIVHALHFIDTQRVKGKTLEGVRKNNESLKIGVLDMLIV